MSNHIEEAMRQGIITRGQLDKMIEDHFQHQIDQLKELTNSYGASRN